MNGRWRTMLVACALASTLVTGCSLDAPRSDGVASLDQLVPPDVTAASDPKPIDDPECLDQEAPWASFAPPPDARGPWDGTWQDGTWMAELVDPSHGPLRIGVDENTLGLSSRLAGSNEFKGFEIALAGAIAAALFPDGVDLDKSVEFVPLVTERKVKAVENGEVDMTISAISVSCARWSQVDFSAEYFTATQEFLMRKGAPTLDIANSSVCVTVGSSSIKILNGLPEPPEIIQQPARTDCLVMLKEGTVDAYFGHDSFLYGMVFQDPSLEIRRHVIDVERTAHYGIAIPKDHPEFVQFVNAVLEELMDGNADSAWKQMIDTNFAGLIPPSDLKLMEPPDPLYRPEPSP